MAILEHIKTLFWAIKIQWRVSKFYILWNFGKALFFGLEPIAVAYVLGRLLDVVGRLAFQAENLPEVDEFYWWLAGLFVLTSISVIYWPLGYFIEQKYHP